MELRTSFTADELIEIFEQFGFETSISEPENDDEAWVLTCALGYVGFSCVLRPHGMIERVMILSTRFIFENPFKYINRFNSNHSATSAYVHLDSDGDVGLDEDGDPTIVLRMWLTFDGGVTADHLELLIAAWVDDLYEFWEVEFEDETDETELPEMTDQVREMTVADQIEWVLGDSVSRSAREIADHLMLEKHSVNSALYKDKDKFKRDSGQPPRWSLVD